MAYNQDPLIFKPLKKMYFSKKKIKSLLYSKSSKTVVYKAVCLNSYLFLSKSNKMYYLVDLWDLDI